MPQQTAVFLAKPSAQMLIEIAEQPRPQLRWIKPTGRLNPTPQDRIQAPGDLCQWQQHLPAQMHLPDLHPHAFERLRTHRRKEAHIGASRPEALDLPIAVSGHTWPEAMAEKRKLDLRKLAPTAAVLAIDYLGLLEMHL